MASAEDTPQMNPQLYPGFPLSAQWNPVPVPLTPIAFGNLLVTFSLPP